MLRTAHLFAGMGGSHLAAHLLHEDEEQWESVISVEKNRRCLDILRTHFPDERLHDDVTTLSGADLGADLVIMGFPCTDLSVAGKGAGLVEGSASSLFFHGLRIAVEARAPFLFVENVFAFLSNKQGASFEVALRSFQAQGYGDISWTCNRASDVGAPHHRTRVWMLARWTGEPVHGDWVRPARWGTRGRVDGNRLSIFEDRLPSMEGAVWPTMRASDDRGVGRIGSKSHLAHVRQHYLTATLQEYEQRSGKLNPRWCSALMGWPLGWTEGSTEDMPWPAEEGAWPVPPDGRPQHPWEPSRLVEKEVKDVTRAPQIRALGNAWVPSQAVAAWRELMSGEGRGQLTLF